MWRRNDIQVDKMKEVSRLVNDYIKNLVGEKQYKKMLRPEYRDASIEQEMDNRINEIKKSFYDRVIQQTKDDDPTIQKTIKNYRPYIIYNKSNIHFILHNTYATLKYLYSNIQVDDFPFLIIEPISNTLCLCLFLNENEIDQTQDYYEIPIEVLTDDDVVKECFVKGYITYTATSFIVDETNKDYVE